LRKSNYSLSECLFNVICLIKTKIFYNKCRLIRFPIVVRGKRYIDFGYNLTTGRQCQIEVNGVHDHVCLCFGKNINIGNNVRIQCAEKISIGDNVLMGSRITIIDNSHGSYSGEVQDNPSSEPDKRMLKTENISIGNNVWIGDGVVIQSGVKIGDGCVIAANSVVTKSFPDSTMLAGVPANAIKVFNDESMKWEKV
jgi:acetyltransferase-like isoleucine patch superfamily enzyme